MEQPQLNGGACQLSFLAVWKNDKDEKPTAHLVDDIQAHAPGQLVDIRVEDPVAEAYRKGTASSTL